MSDDLNDWRSDLPDYIGKDGNERNLLKLRHEARPWLRALGSTLKDLLMLKGGIRNITHNYVDIFVECRRASPYFSGHIAPITVPIGVVSFCYAVWSLIK